MGRKAVPTGLTRHTIRTILGQSRDSRLQGLARSIADVQERSGSYSLGIIYAKHIEMLEPYIPALEKILGRTVVLEHMAMLEEAYSWGVDLKWQVKNQD